MIGETIGNFKLVSRLGKGGMGEVFLAEHVTMQTPAAVKILNEDISSDHEHVARFFNEMKVVSKIKHSGTVKIFDSGFYRNHAYLTMEFLDGESLAQRVQRGGPMPIMQLVDIAAQIASVLDAVHRSGFTHRDLKPENIYIVRDDERASGERVKVLDFGIAKLTNTMASTGPKTRGTMGTPGYMAPEQWGDSSKVDWRADVYSLGCVVYELATGRPPFICNTIPEAYAKHLTEIPAPVAAHRPDIPPQLDQLILQLLAKDPMQRASSMADVAAMLSRVTGRAPTGPVSAVHPAPFTAAPTLTTMGGSAAQITTAQKPRSKKALWGVLAGVVVVGGIVAIAVTQAGGSSDSPTTAGPAKPTEPAAKLPDPAAKPPEPAAKPPEPAKPVATPEPAKPVAAPPEPAAKPPEPAAKPPEPAVKPPEPPPAPPAPEPAKPAHHTTKPPQQKPPQQKPPQPKPPQPEQKPPQPKPPQQKPPADDDLGGRT